MCGVVEQRAAAALIARLREEVISGRDFCNRVTCPVRDGGECDVVSLALDALMPTVEVSEEVRARMVRTANRALGERALAVLSGDWSTMLMCW